MAVEKIENYTKPVTVNPFIADLENFAAGDAFAVRLAPSKRAIRDDKGEPTGEYKFSTAGQKSLVQDAARAKGLTAREAERTELDDGTVRVVFTLTTAQKSGPRKPRKPADKPAKG